MAFSGLSALEKLIRGAYSPPHEYRPSLKVFPDVSVDTLAKDLNVVERATSNGRAEHPTTESSSLDEVEYAIIERIYSERTAAHQSLVDQLDTHIRRLNALDFEGRFSVIQHAAPEAVAEFRAEANQGRDELYQLRRALWENENERNVFRRRHKLFRAPQIQTPTTIALKITLLCALFVSETYVNGVFLAKGSELGFIGGVVEAFVFAVLNVVVSFFIGLVGVRQGYHTSIVRKLIALISLVGWLCFAVVLNFALAHYREISGALYDDAGARVIAHLRANPLGLVDIKSWLFIAIGLVWSTIALADGIIFTDPFPGYAKLEKRVRAAHANYMQTKNDLIESLRAIRDDAAVRMQDAQSDLNKRRLEHEAILQGRVRVLELFEQHQHQLERAGRALLEQYRGVNRKIRSTAAPNRFGEIWQLDRISAKAELPENLVRKNLDNEIKSAQDLLSEEIKAIRQAFEEAVQGYRQIDDLLPEEQNVSVPVKAA
jgi:hypothetical protein